MEETTPQIRFGARQNRCPYCHEAVTPTEKKRACNACMAWQHEACWRETKQVCASCGLQRGGSGLRTRQEVSQGLGLVPRLKARLNLAFVLALAMWTAAGGLVGSVAATWVDLPVPVGVVLGVVLGLALGIGGGLAVIPAEEDDEAQESAEATGTSP